MAAELTCRELVEVVTDYLEGRLPPAETKRLEEHLAACEACTVYLDQIRRTIELTGTLRGEDLAPEAQEALLAAFREWRRGPA